MRSSKNILFSESDNVKTTSPQLALVSVSVESSLLGHDIQAYEQVVKLLNKKYHCGVYDCYDHPEYLNEILKTLPEDSYYSVMASIKKGLDEFVYLDGISQFLNELKK